MWQTNVVVQSGSSVPVVLMNNRLYYWDGLIHLLLFLYVHTSQYHLVFIRRWTGQKQKKKKKTISLFY